MLTAEAAVADIKTAAKVIAVAIKMRVNHAETLSNMKKKQPTAQSSIGRWLNDEAHHIDEPKSLKKQENTSVKPEKPKSSKSDTKKK